MATQPEQLRARTKQFAIRIVTLFKSLPKTGAARIIGKQVMHLLAVANELLAIFAASHCTARQGRSAQ